MTSTHYNRIFWLIVFVALALRVTGVQYGLPHIYHQDEPIIVNHAMAIGVHGWNPQFYVLPPFTIYFCFIFYGVAYVLAQLSGIVAGADEFGAMFIKDPTFFYLSGRLLLGVVFGTASVAALAVIVRRHFGQKAALLTATFLALSYLHAQHSHYIYTDIPLTFFIILMFGSLLSAADSPSPKNYLMTGLWLGLAASVKYTAAFFVPVLVVMHLFLQKNRGERDGLKLLGLAAVMALVTFAVIAPFTFIDWAEFKRQLLQQAHSESQVGLLHHLTYSILHGTCGAFVFFLFMGLTGIRRTTNLKIKIAVLMAGWFYLVNAFFSQPFARYMMPILPFLCLIAANGWLSATAKPGLLRQYRFPLLLFVLVSLAVPSVYADVLSLRADTRDEALSWIHQNVPAETAIAVDNRFYAPRLNPNEDQLKQKLQAVGEADAAKKKRIELALEAASERQAYTIHTLLKAGESEESSFLFDRPYIEMTLTALRRERIRFVIVNTTEKRPEVRRFLEESGKALELRRVFNPYWDAQRTAPLDPYLATAATDYQPELFARRSHGPYLEVYELK